MKDSDNVDYSDSFGRQVNYLRISVTDRCNLRCKYCMPAEGVEKCSHNQILRNEEIVNIVKGSAKLGINKIRITGGEPLVRKGIISLISEINEIEGINEIALTTNGILLGEYAKELKKAGLQRVNISLDTLKHEKFAKMTRGGNLDKVINSIKVCKEIGLVPIKVNTVLIGGFNDNEIDDFMELSYKYKLQWRIIELMPIGEVANWSKEHFISGKELLNIHPMLQSEDNQLGQRVKYYSHKKLPIKIGLIDALSGKFCSTCNRIRLTSDGRIKPCLHSNLEYDIKPYLYNEKDLIVFLKNCIANKPKEHKLTEKDYIPIKRNMNRIGG